VPSAKRPARKKSIVVAGAHEAIDPWAEGVDHLRRLDPKWRAIIERVGPCRLELRPDRFGTLVRAIIGQQISSKAAASIDKKVRELAGEPHTPSPLLHAGEQALRNCGLSGVKARYVLNLAQAVQDGSVPLNEVHTWEDDAIIKALTSVKGIGPWTAEMFLIFALGRPDVLSAGDLGIRAGLKDFHGLDELPGPKQCRELTEPWRPFRTVAMWYLWRQFDDPKENGSSTPENG
jgi:DNA-3-methyladenine glycosylase II